MNEGGVLHLILRSPLPGRSLYLTECYKNWLWEGEGRGEREKVVPESVDDARGKLADGGDVAVAAAA
jgi:hypothetical protein